MSSRNACEAVGMHPFEFARLSATDAANRRMRREGRTCWNEDDVAEYVRVQDQLWPIETELEYARRDAITHRRRVVAERVQCVVHAGRRRQRRRRVQWGTLR